MIKGHQHQICLDNGPSASESVPVFKFWICLGPLVRWEGDGGPLVLSAARDASFLLSTCFCRMTCAFALLSLKSDSVSHSTGGTVLSRVCHYIKGFIERGNSKLRGVNGV